jgi:Protein of unknown function (DUF4242)
MNGSPRKTYVAECFWPGVTRADLSTLHARASRAGGRSSGSEPEARYRGWMLMPEDEVVFCFFDALSADAASVAARAAGIPYARIVESTAQPHRT